MSFLEMHQRDRALLMPNAWDAGSAKVLASLGFEAIATTSSGFAATLGRLDYEVSRAEAMDHSATLVEAIGIPVSADLENGFADDPAQVAETIRMARAVGLAGCSIEDATGREDEPIYEAGLAKERIAAAAEASGDLVLTARCENFLHGRADLADTIARLQAYQDAGADVLYAPGLATLEDVRTVCAEVDRPVNVLCWPGLPAVPDLEAAGVRRISVGGAFAYAAIAGLHDAAIELRDEGTFGWFERVAVGARTFKKAAR
jgi:2-methylisocitrate lyase-like PEP mutase family enzyme